MGLIGLHQVHLSLIVKKRVLEDVMIAMDAPITCGLMTKDVGPRPAAAKPFLLIGMLDLLYAKKVFQL